MSQTEQKIPILVIGGPTAVGKTELSMKLAQRFNGEIINGDSLQVYRNLDIGTGKITPDEMAGTPHYLFDILDENEPYDASRFKYDATQLICDIHARGKLPIVVGGTGLYLEGLLYDLEFGGNTSHDPTVRQQLQAQLQLHGALFLWEKLHSLDAVAADKIPCQNTRRVIRALEVIEVTGKRFSDQASHQEQVATFNDCVIVLNREREALYQRINQRVEQMVEQGLEQEAFALYQKANGQEWQSVKGIGYKEWWPYFVGESTKEDVISAIQQNSRRYAKRQLTWFRNRLKQTRWIEMDDMQAGIQEAIRIVEQHLRRTNT